MQSDIATYKTVGKYQGVWCSDPYFHIHTHTHTHTKCWVRVLQYHFFSFHFTSLLWLYLLSKELFLLANVRSHHIWIGWALNIYHVGQCCCVEWFLYRIWYPSVDHWSSSSVSRQQTLKLRDRCWQKFERCFMKLLKIYNFSVTVPCHAMK